MTRTLNDNPGILVNAPVYVTRKLTGYTWRLCFAWNEI